jgi:hypothetical protein
MKNLNAFKYNKKKKILSKIGGIKIFNKKGDSGWGTAIVFKKKNRYSFIVNSMSTIIFGFVPSDADSDKIEGDFYQKFGYFLYNLF